MLWGVCLCPFVPMQVPATMRAVVGRYGTFGTGADYVVRAHCPNTSLSKPRGGGRAGSLYATSPSPPPPPPPPPRVLKDSGAGSALNKCS